MSLVSNNPHQPSTSTGRFNSWKLVMALILKDLPGECEKWVLYAVKKVFQHKEEETMQNSDLFT